MTRFARAKGSKSSNEKLPDDGTPWEVMKQQLIESKKQIEDAKKREEVEQQRIDNYQNFLKEQKVQKRKATWCDFPEVDQSRKRNKSAAGKTKSAVNNNNAKNMEDQVDQQSKNFVQDKTDPKSKETKFKSAKKKKNKKNLSNNIVHGSANGPQTQETLVDALTNDPSTYETLTESKSNLDTKKKKIKKPTKIQADNDSNNEDNSIKHSTSPQNKPLQKKKKDKFTNNSQAIRRKPVNDSSFQLIINGKEVDLVRFEGFPIMKKDADRLSELKGNMMKKGIPKSEVQRTIKLERRRAEKALARLKRDVCYNCRKGGHNLSDCPELKSKIPGVEAGDGMCFKCGSTEHRQFECKVQRDKEFRFATCFICKDQGHIARQCPDNPKGLYPNGGACKLCGDVTHLRKDCPTVKDQKEETSIKLGTLNDDEIEGIAQQNTKAPPTEEKGKKPKKITF